VEGLGMAIHTWGGNANSSTVLLKVYPDGGVETFCGSQDLGTGTRTSCAMVQGRPSAFPSKRSRSTLARQNTPPADLPAAAPPSAASANRIAAPEWMHSARFSI